MSEDFFRGYLLGYAAILAVSCGSLAICLLHNLTGGAWGTAIRGHLETAAKTVPLVAILFIPIALGLDDLYLWARHEAVEQNHMLHHKALYLNAPFFYVRAVIYFVVWTALAIFVTRRPMGTPGAETVGGPGLVLFGLTMTFASYDWFMSLDPLWFSTMYGPLTMTGQVLTAFAFAIALHAKRIEIEALHDLGKLLLAFVMLWAYLSFSQWLIVWSANLPEEAPWYLTRFQGGWQWVGIALIGLHFALPFTLLLSRRAKRAPPTLAAIAAFILAMRYIDLLWHITPGIEAAPLRLHVFTIVMPVVLVAIWLAAFMVVGKVWKSRATSTSGS
jgi:hypothetical protein